MTGVVILLLYLTSQLCLKLSGAIDCYQCGNVGSPEECHSTDICPNGTHCVLVHYLDNNTYTLRCEQNNECSSPVTTAPVTPTIVVAPTLPPVINGTTTVTDTRNSTEPTISVNTTISTTTTTTIRPLLTTNSGATVGAAKRYANNNVTQFCCNEDACNKHISDTTAAPIPTHPSTHAPGACVDHSNECEMLLDKYHVFTCNDTHEAKELCKKSCHLCDLVDGNWSDWSEWSDCSVTCDNGTKGRNRTCNNPAPFFGGDDCEGEEVEQTDCTESPCPRDGSWATWSNWTGCSVTCGLGLQKRVRNCSHPYPDKDGLFCLGESSDHRVCYEKPCYDGHWEMWSHWSKCSHSCDIGLKTRTRNCSSLFGHTCSGDPMEADVCFITACEGSTTNLTHGDWVDWSSWSQCSASCGVGLRSRDRQCDGTMCKGHSEDFVTCIIKECPVRPSLWMEWSPWNSCSHSCGFGIKSRARSCNGSECVGDSHESSLCKERDCQEPLSAFLVNGIAMHGPTNRTILFSNVITNIGHDYDNTTGVFNCSIPGLYSFAISIEKSPDANEAYCTLMKNNMKTVFIGSRSAFYNDHTYQQASNSALLELSIGDTIYLGGCSDPKTFTEKSTFSGTLIATEYS